MHIEASKKKIAKSDKEVFDFLTDIKNFEVLMPDNIDKFEVLDENTFKFALKGMPEIVLRLKEQNPNIQIVGVQPTDESKIPGIRKWPQEYLPKIFDPKKVDKVMEVSELDATLMAKKLAKEEGIFAGMSSGGAATVAFRLAELLDSGTIVSIVCDRGDRYLSSDLFD